MERNKIYAVILLSFVIAILSYSYTPTISFAFMCIGILLLYVKRMKDSILRTNTIFGQVVWLIVFPIFFAGLTLGIVEFMFVEMLGSDTTLNLFMIFFFVSSWGMAMYCFELRKLKVTVQIINTIFISGLSLTFLSYYKLDVLKEVLTPDIIAEFISYNVEVDAFIDIMIKTITLPFVLAGMWSNVVVAYREYRGDK
ncbi:hypothetical protein [Priestia taiwanensis]|uniref:Uncharacterized protein n=1 Tax=Priestia taiwanensis TaxID=1347902 RepID=A0A917AR36_9BACI|nr:hypothetical protein [Priestia taiwanensis]MBM7363209.1 hypothetical protein [Priestia taiwanensis]GGE68555.1 hypothetical protein GCM10007140_18280 [Priestia taiwanensis]